MPNWFKKDKKEAENDKKVTSIRVTTGQERMIHSSSLTSFTVQQTTTERTETRTTASFHQISRSSPFASDRSLNSLSTSGSSSSLQYGNKDSNTKLPTLYTKSVLTDAVPFTRNGLRQSTPARSAFTSTPLTTTSSARSINMVQYPYAENRRTRSVSVTDPMHRINNTQKSSITSKPKETFSRAYSTPQNNNVNSQKLIVKVTKSLEFYDDPKSKVPVYKTRSKNRGRLLLINNIKFVKEKHMRKGAELDEQNIAELFKQMQFEVVPYKNLNKKEMESKIKKFCKDKSLKKFDIAAVIIMSHGTGTETNDSTQIMCTDEELLETTWIINQFDTVSCPYLIGKPKIFMFQCCRGDKKDTVQHDSISSRPIRKLSDMLIAYSTVPGFVSHRNPEEGTWYIQEICKVFMEHAHNQDVENLLKIVDNNLACLVGNSGSMQTSSFENRGFKTCYLHPQLHE